MLYAGTHLWTLYTPNQLSSLIFYECMWNFLILSQKSLWTVPYKAPGYVPCLRPSPASKFLQSIRAGINSTHKAFQKDFRDHKAVSRGTT